MSIRQRYILWGLILAGIILRAIIIFQPLEVLFSRWGSDDLFYYTQIAGNIAENGFVSFDGIHPTNGFQPLFLFLLVPFGNLLLNDIHASLIIVLFICTVLTSITAWQMSKLFSDWKLGHTLGLIATGMFLLHPKLLSVTFNGTEASLSFLAVILALRAYKWVGEGRRLLATSLIFGALVITRLDFSAILVILGVAGLASGHHLLNWLKTAVLPLTLVILWMVLNQQYFGSPLPASGEAKQLHAEVIQVDYLRQWLSTYSTSLMSESKISITMIALMLLGGIGMLLSKEKRKIGLFLFGTSAITGVIPILTLGAFRDWYLIIQFLFVVFTASVGIELILNRFKRITESSHLSDEVQRSEMPHPSHSPSKLHPRTPNSHSNSKLPTHSPNSHSKLPTLNSSLTLLLILTLTWFEAQHSKRTFNGYDTVLACKQFEKRLEKGTMIGAFNAGIVNCVMGPKYNVINLDGVVNNEVIQYLQTKELGKFIETKRITHLIDNQGSIDFYLKSFDTRTSTISLVDRYGKIPQDLSLVQFNPE